jgi:hypothetical protein
MSHGRNSRSLDHAKIAKTGFLAGLGLFVVGAVGELAGHSAASSMSETLESVLLMLEVLGVAVAFFVPVVFGAVLPLAE